MGYQSDLNSIGVSVTSAKGVDSKGRLYGNFPASEFGAKGDFVADDSNAIIAAVNAAAAAGGGTVILPAGKFKITKPIIWKTNVSLRGQGVGKSILAASGQAFAVISYDSAWASATNIHQNCSFTDFEIDGSGFTDTVYNLGTKGIFIQYMRNASFQNLYIHDTPATGLGADFLDKTVIDNVVMDNCGRLWTTGGLGGSGIGIGTGGLTEEHFAIVNCKSYRSGQYGIFVEKQGEVAGAGKGIAIANCVVANGRNYGIGNKGATSVVIANNITYGNTTGGINVEGTTMKDCIVSDNIITDNTGHGIYITSNGDGCSVKDNKIGRNGGKGVQVDVYTGLKNIDISNNEIFANLVGITLANNTATMESLKVTNNKIYLNQNDAIQLGSIVLGGLIAGNQIYNNSKNATSTDAITINYACSYLNIINNMIMDYQGTKTQYRAIVQKATSTFDFVRIEGNDCRGNVTAGAAAVAIAGTNTAATVITNNLT